MTVIMSRLHVLVISRQNEPNTALLELIESLGCTISRLSNCLLGRKQLETELSTDLIIIDSEIGDQCNIEFLNWKNKDFSLASIPVIMAGTEFTPAIINRFVELQIMAILLIPTDAETLRHKIQFAVENGRYSLLVVDDNAGIREVLSAMLELQRYQVTEADSVDAALDHITAKKFDAVISDILMPGKNGFDLLDTVKESHPELPVMLITGYSGRFTPEDALAHGADAYLTKPFNSQQLRSTLSQVLTARSLRKAARK